MSVVFTAPERSHEQRMAALEAANRIRVFRADWKKRAHRGEVSPGAVLLDPPPVFDSMKALELLMSKPGVGRVKAQKMLRVAGASPVKTIGGLSMRQRVELAALLGS